MSPVNSTRSLTTSSKPLQRAGQAMIETVLAVLIITSLFLCLFTLAHRLTAKILLEHASMRVARARAVGMNRFMCLKTARLSVVPVAGERLWPKDKALTVAEELGRFENYLLSEDESVARGILEYEGWNRLSVPLGDESDVQVRLESEWFELGGQAGVERHADFYLEDQGR